MRQTVTGAHLFTQFKLFSKEITLVSIYSVQEQAKTSCNVNGANNRLARAA